MEIVEECFGYLEDKEVKKITLKNDYGMSVSVINYGATIQSIVVPDRSGNLLEILLNFKTLEEYVNDTKYRGSIVGRYANMIKDGILNIDGMEYQLSKNEDGKHHSRGGFFGFNKKLWSCEAWSNNRIASVKMTYRSPDGEEGYPGTLDAEVVFTLDNKNSFIISYTAETDKKTILNLSHPVFLNLSGIEECKSILGHFLQIHSGFYLETDDRMIPTGKVLEVKDGPINFKVLRKIGERIKETKLGYNNCFIFPGYTGDMFHALTLSDPLSGLSLDLLMDKPGLHICTANFIDPPHCAVCIEPQNYTKVINNPDLSSPILCPGEVYNRTVFLRFNVLKD